MSINRFHKNVPGDFYTTGECLACGLPEKEASECFAPLVDGNFDTYIVRQPQTPEDVEKVCSAVKVCCVDAIRYCGHDKHIRYVLGEAYCDGINSYNCNLLRINLLRLLKIKFHSLSKKLGIS